MKKDGSEGKQVGLLAFAKGVALFGERDLQTLDLGAFFEFPLSFLADLVFEFFGLVLETDFVLHDYFPMVVVLLANVLQLLLDLLDPLTVGALDGPPDAVCTLHGRVVALGLLLPFVVAGKLALDEVAQVDKLLYEILIFLSPHRNHPLVLVVPSRLLLVAHRPVVLLYRLLPLLFTLVQVAHLSVVARSDIGVPVVGIQDARLRLHHFRLSRHSVLNAHAVQDETWLLLSVFQPFIDFELLHRSLHYELFYLFIAMRLHFCLGSPEISQNVLVLRHLRSVPFLRFVLA